MSDPPIDLRSHPPELPRPSDPRAVLRVKLSITVLGRMQADRSCTAPWALGLRAETDPKLAKAMPNSAESAQKCSNLVETALRSRQCVGGAMSTESPTGSRGRGVLGAASVVGGVGSDSVEISSAVGVSRGSAHWRTVSAPHHGQSRRQINRISSKSGSSVRFLRAQIRLIKLWAGHGRPPPSTSYGDPLERPPGRHPRSTSVGTRSDLVKPAQIRSKPQQTWPNWRNLGPHGLSTSRA